jgi:hypothetical protein
MTVRQQQAMAVLRRKYPLISAAAIVGNLSAESGRNLDSTVERPHADHGSGGIAEWRLGRKANLYAFAQGLGKPVTDLETQCLFLMHELDGPEFAVLNAQLTKPATGQSKISLPISVRFLSGRIWRLPGSTIVLPMQRRS